MKEKKLKLKKTKIANLLDFQIKKVKGAGATFTCGVNTFAICGYWTANCTGNGGGDDTVSATDMDEQTRCTQEDYPTGGNGTSGCWGT